MDRRRTLEPGAAPSTDRDSRFDEAARHLRVLGLSPGATSDEIRRAHARLVADLTPGPEASHRNVALAQSLLDEVNTAFDSLRLSSVA